MQISLQCIYADNATMFLYMHCNIVFVQISQKLNSKIIATVYMYCYSVNVQVLLLCSYFGYRNIAYLNRHCFMVLFEHSHTVFVQVFATVNYTGIATLYLYRYLLQLIIQLLQHCTYTGICFS